MNEPSPKPQRPWARWLFIVAIAGLLLLLYPQLMDFGAEIYRLFST